MPPCSARPPTLRSHRGGVDAHAPGRRGSRHRGSLRGWLIDEDADWGTAAPVDPAHPVYDGYQRAWRDGEWWTSRGSDKAFGQKLPALFERCGLQDIRHEAATEVVRGGSPWTSWWTVTLEVIDELGGGDESDRRELEVMTTVLAEPSVWLQRELLHACWGRRAGETA